MSDLVDCHKLACEIIPIIVEVIDEPPSTDAFQLRLYASSFDELGVVVNADAMYTVGESVEMTQQADDLISSQLVFSLFSYA